MGPKQPEGVNQSEWLLVESLRSRSDDSTITELLTAARAYTDHVRCSVDDEDVFDSPIGFDNASAVLNACLRRADIPDMCVTPGGPDGEV